MTAISATRHDLAIGVIGGPTVVIDYGGTRFVTDPTFDEPRDYGRDGQADTSRRCRPPISGTSMRCC